MATIIGEANIRNDGCNIWVYTERWASIVCCTSTVLSGVITAVMITITKFKLIYKLNQK